ncbi:U2 small nuclear ribonucleoprotein B [Pleurostoma richardsiae]|uniref:U2 small nuclear ribonucleoprotein B n=1 Tax=Pleurostoma richardsiae TaxID=41990 RepID=A0AA38RWD3_9PEZI|nr:U2 small nuclear ribonucleoprotein B [Pleurostoma richardsiae]
MSAKLPVPPRAPPPGSGVPAKLPVVPPNQTLYVRDLPSAKIQKEDLRTALYMLFSTYGPVLDVVALKTMKMRGQAHIVYRDIQTATQAMRALEGFNFLGHELKIQYAKTKSNTVAKLDGTFKLPSAAANVEVTELQHSIFNAPVPGSAAASAPGAAPTGLPSKPPQADHVMEDAKTPESRGQKRTREEEDEDEDSDVAMEEESDED